MKESDKKKFADELTTTAQIYHKTLTDDVLMRYWVCLKEYEFSDILAALIRYETEIDAKPNERTKYMPLPHDIIRVLHSMGKKPKEKPKVLTPEEIEKKIEDAEHRKIFIKYYNAIENEFQKKKKEIENAQNIERIKLNMNWNEYFNYKFGQKDNIFVKALKNAA